MRILIDGRDDDSIERHARMLLREQFSKDKGPRGIPVARALVPDWCDVCQERCWGVNGGMYAVCKRCRGEGKTPLGFSA